MQSTWNAEPSARSLRADDVGDAPADAGVDLVEDQAGRGRARRPIAGLAEAVARTSRSAS